MDKKPSIPVGSQQPDERLAARILKDQYGSPAVVL